MEVEIWIVFTILVVFVTRTMKTLRRAHIPETNRTVKMQ